jgi:membrane protein implicated in regulation of membrane protease activity
MSNSVAFRSIEHAIIFSLAAGALLVLLGLLWLVIPVVVIIVVWEVYTYYRDVNKDFLDMTSAVEGLKGVALTDVDGEGKVDVGGRIWNAQSVTFIGKETIVYVVKKEGSVLEVEPVITRS